MFDSDLKLVVASIIVGGFGIMILWFMLVGVVQIIQKSLAWIDDSNNPTYNILLDKAAIWFGCTIRPNSASRYYDDDDDTFSSEDILTFVGVCLFPIPGVLCIAYLLYPITIAIIAYIGILYVVRMVKRQSKMIKSHINDKTVHKE